MGTDSRPGKHDRGDYCIVVDFERGSPDPARVFVAMSELIYAFEFIDKELAACVDARIRPAVVLQEIEAGSIKTWLANRIEDIPDSDLAKLDWRAIVGQYLVRAKHLILEFLKGRDTIERLEELEPLNMELRQLAQDTQVQPVAPRQSVSAGSVLMMCERVSSAIAVLSETDQVAYVTEEDETPINKNFSISAAACEELLATHNIENRVEMFLQIKKPDYLGTSMWEFRHRGHILTGKISHEEWLRSFQSGDISLGPGDCVRALVNILTMYDGRHEVVRSRYDIVKIFDVIHAPNVEQGLLFKELDDTEPGEEDA